MRDALSFVMIKDVSRCRLHPASFNGAFTAYHGVSHDYVVVK